MGTKDHEGWVIGGGVFFRRNFDSVAQWRAGEIAGARWFFIRENS